MSLLTPTRAERHSGAGRGSSVSRLGRLDGVPELPRHHVSSSIELEACRQSLMSPRSRVVAITAVREMSWDTAWFDLGLAGAGKSVLAAAVCREDRIRKHFMDGIFWINVGQDGAGTEMAATTMQSALASRLGCPLGVLTSHKGKQQLRAFLADKACLIVLDGAFDSVDVLRMDLVDRQSASRILVTTRNSRLVTDLDAVEIPLNKWSREQAAALLSGWSCKSIAENDDALTLALECEELPLSLAVSAALAADGTSWREIAAKVKGADIGFMKRAGLDPIDKPVFRALAASVGHLSDTHPETARRYRDLAVFPRGESIPESVVSMLWNQTTALPTHLAPVELETLAGRALLTIEGKGDNRRVRIHDLSHDYLRSTHPNLARVHYEVLEAYRARCADGWASGPADGYFFPYLGHHLRGAGRKNELRNLLIDSDWLAAKMKAEGLASLLADFEHFAEDDSLMLVRGALRLSASHLELDPSLLRSQLRGRLRGVAPEEIINQLEQSSDDTPWLGSLTASLTAPGDPLVRALDGHTDAVRAVAITRDGTRALSASNDHSLRLWDLAEGKTVHEFRGHTDLVNALVLTPDGRHALSASSDHTMKLWDLETGELMRSFEGHTSAITAVVLTRDGHYALSASYDHTLKLWNLATGVMVREFRGHKNLVTAMVILPDGKQALSASWDHTLRLWDLSTGETLRILHGHTGWLSKVVVTPDGKHALSTSWDHTMRLWELATGTTVREFKGHTGWLTTVVVTADGKHALSASNDSTLRLWDMATGKTIHELRGHTKLVNAVELTPDGKHALSASWDQTLRLWDLATGKTVREIQGHTNSVNAVEFTPDGKHAISASWDQTLQVWDIAAARTVSELRGHNSLVNAVALTPDGRQAVSASWDHTLRLWDIGSGRTVRELHGHTNLVTAVVVTAGSQHALSASWDQTLRIWDLSTGKTIRELRGHTGWLTTVVLSPDGRQALSASNDKTMRLWDLATGKTIRQLVGHTELVTSVVITPDGKRALSASWDHTMRLWDLGTGRTIREIAGQTSLVTAVAITPDGKRALSSSNDHALRLWDLATGETIREFRGHTNLINAVAVTPDGHHALSASDDQTVRLWELKTGRLVSCFAADNPLTSCGISALGNTFVARDSGGRVHLLKLNTH